MHGCPCQNLQVKHSRKHVGVESAQTVPGRTRKDYLLLHSAAQPKQQAHFCHHRSGMSPLERLQACSATVSNEMLPANVRRQAQNGLLPGRTASSFGKAWQTSAESFAAASSCPFLSCTANAKGFLLEVRTTFRTVEGTACTVCCYRKGWHPRFLKGLIPVSSCDVRVVSRNWQ